MKNISPSFLLFLSTTLIFLGCSSTNEENFERNFKNKKHQKTTKTIEETINEPSTIEHEHPSIYVSIVTHNEDEFHKEYPNFLEDEEEFWAQRNGAAKLAQMLDEEGATYNFQTDWNYLLASLEYDKGNNLTNNKNLLNYFIEDLSNVSVDPHSHKNMGYNMGDVADLINQHGIETSGVVGGYIVAPLEDSILEEHFEPIEANMSDYVWEPTVLWGGGTGKHVNEEEYWVSGVWYPTSAELWDTHNPDGHIPIVGNYAPGWEGLDELLEQYEAGELDKDKIYTHTTTIGQAWLTDDSYIEEVRQIIKSYQEYVDAGIIQWTLVQDVADTWYNQYGAKPNILHYEYEEVGITEGEGAVTAPGFTKFTPLMPDQIKNK